MTHNERSGVAHFAADDDRECLALIRELLGFLPGNNLDDAPRWPTDDPVRPRRRLARHAGAGLPEPAVRHARPHPRDRRRRALPRGAPALRAEHRRGLRADGRPPGGHRRQPAGAPGRHARHRRVGEGRALRAVLRRVQHPAGDHRGRAGLPAGHGAGVRRHHPPRREAALRLRRGHGAEGDRHHAQGVRRRLLRHGEQAHPHRLQLRVADGRDRRHGARRRREHPVPARARGRADAGGAAGARRRRSSARRSRTRTSPPRAGSSTRSSGRARRAARSSRRSTAARAKRASNPPKKHGNIPPVASTMASACTTR
ncbi:MAG: hypothetical protein MZV64_13690 [Ignavibacteriales bacterium]|nr:hypothetical protein [Ignavibacteriales bacterium]